MSEMKFMKMRHENTGIVSAIGRTPLVELPRVIPECGFRIYAKLEGLNPGGSMKDRPAFHLLRRAIELGLVDSETTIIESSSGNMGIGLAQACRHYGLKFVCIVDPKATAQNVRLLKAYGATVDLVTEPDPVSGEFLDARLSRVRALLKAHEKAFWPDQYDNLLNAEAHHQTISEIVEKLGGFPDFVFCAVSTCGTLRGCSDFLRIRQARTKVIAVDAVGSAIFGERKGKRLIPGHGSSVAPGLFAPHLAQDYVCVTDLECIAGCRRLLQTEAILAGGSSGAVISAIQKLSESIPTGSVCVAILGDRGERYLDTIYSDEWVREQFGSTPDIERWAAPKYLTDAAT